MTANNFQYIKMKDLMLYKLPLDLIYIQQLQFNIELIVSETVNGELQLGYCLESINDEPTHLLKHLKGTMNFISKDSNKPIMIYDDIEFKLIQPEFKEKMNWQHSLGYPLRDRGLRLDSVIPSWKTKAGEELFMRDKILKK